jgi:sodium/pantothenate symporter
MNWGVIIPIIVYLLAMLAVAGYLHRYLKDRRVSFQEQFFIGGRSLGPLVLALTMLASAASAGTFIGGPGVAYDVGFAWALVGMTQIGMGIYILGILGKKFAIMARKIGAVTLSDFLRERYGSAAVVVGSSLGVVIFLGAYMVAQFAGGARILEAVTGLPYQAGLLMFGVTVAAYTTYGGFRAVALTDAIQGILMILGGVILWIFLMSRSGGLTSLVEQLRTEQPDMLTLPGPGDITPFMLFSYFVLLGIAAIGLPHASVRAMAYRDSRTMHKAMMYSIPIMFLFSLFFTTAGPMMRVLYPNADAPDSVLPTFIVDSMPGLLAGLVLGAPLAAVMSTVSSMLLVTSSAIIKDLYTNYVNPRASERMVTNLSYLVTSVIGIAVVLIALTPPEYLQYVVLYAIGGLEATFFAPIVMGLYWKRASRWGAISSMYLGLGSYLLIAYFFERPFGMDPVVTALSISIATMVVVSLLTPGPSPEILRKFWGAGAPSLEGQREEVGSAGSRAAGE